MILAIDPGPLESAWVLMDPEYQNPCKGGIVANSTLLYELMPTLADQAGLLAIEMIAGYGMAVGREVFETCVWIGKFEFAFPGVVRRVYRKDVKLHLCGNTRAKDSNVNQALRDRLVQRYGLDAEKELKGTKAKPGPCYGFKSHLWAALAVGVAFAERHPDLAYIYRKDGTR